MISKCYNIAMEKIPNLIDNDGVKLKDIESAKRAELFSDIKTKRSQRDSLLKEASSFKTKVKDIFSGHEIKNLKKEAKDIQNRLYRNTKFTKEETYKNLSEKAEKTIKETIDNPLIELRKIYSKREKDIHQINNKELKDKEDEIIKNFKYENVTESFSNKILREKAVTYLNDFLSNKSVWNTLTDNPDYKSHDYYFSIKLKKDADGFPVNLAKSTLKAVDNLINKDGISNIDSNIELFKLIETSKKLCAYEALDESIKNNLLLLMDKKGVELNIHYLSQLENLVDFAVSNSEDFKNKLNDKIENCFSEKNWGEINNAAKSSSEYLSKKTLENLDNYLNKYGIDVESIRAPWELYPAIDNYYKYNNIERNIDKIEELESRRPGIVKNLFKEFGICEFQRYPTEVLLKQFDTKDQDSPYGVVLFTNDDWNDVFDSNAEIIESIFKQTDGRLIVRIAEFQSKFSILKRIASFDKRYGEKNKISYLILGAHGYKKGFSDVYYNDLNGKGVSRVKDFFVNKPEIILASCSTGEDDGIAQKISKTYEAIVHAPAIPANLKNVLIDFNLKDRPHFKVEFSEKTGVTYSSGEKTDL